MHGKRFSEIYKTLLFLGAYNNYYAEGGGIRSSFVCYAEAEPGKGHLHSYLASARAGVAVTPS